MVSHIDAQIDQAQWLRLYVGDHKGHSFCTVFIQKHMKGNTTLVMLFVKDHKVHILNT
mgnify:CR=1 FL=1